MATIEWMGKYTAVSMRASLPDDTLIINTCSDNDTDQTGDATRWSWTNPTNRRYWATHKNDPECTAVSLECLWQGTKIMQGQSSPDYKILGGDWRKGKGRRPIGAWNGPGRGLITNPGTARREIYVPAFVTQLHQQLYDNSKASRLLREATAHDGRIALRDFDTGRGIDRNGPMSHAWVLSIILNGDHGQLGALDTDTTQRIIEIQHIAKE